jgi:hypothetical protein
MVTNVDRFPCRFRPAGKIRGAAGPAGRNVFWPTSQTSQPSREGGMSIDLSCYMTDQRFLKSYSATT